MREVATRRADQRERIVGASGNPRRHPRVVPQATEVVAPMALSRVGLHGGVKREKARWRISASMVDVVGEESERGPQLFVSMKAGGLSSMKERTVSRGGHP